MFLNKVEVVTTIILATWPFVMIVLERLYPYRKGLPILREGFWIDLVWYTFIQSYFLKILIFDYMIFPLDKHYHLSSLHIVTAWPLALQVLFFFVVHDFYIYWFHRWQHNSKVLWRIHEAHHSNKEVDWLAGSRSHVMEIIINQTVEFAPIILLGANPLVVPIKALIDAMYGMFIHSNIDVKMGKLGYIFNGPEMHQWHHANHREVFFANYATKLSLWDWIFGTAYRPGYKPDEYGLYYEYPKDYFVQHLFSVKRIDEKKLRDKKSLKWYFNLRPAIIEWFKTPFEFKEKYRKYKSQIRVYLANN
jgi:sterol desaturase/sphingolipid hydroxylase (fatty acid hydroxylase superfamily)